MSHFKTRRVPRPSKACGLGIRATAGALPGPALFCGIARTRLPQSPHSSPITRLLSSVHRNGVTPRRHPSRPVVWAPSRGSSADWARSRRCTKRGKPNHAKPASSFKVRRGRRVGELGECGLGLAPLSAESSAFRFRRVWRRPLDAVHSDAQRPRVLVATYPKRNEALRCADRRSLAALAVDQLAGHVLHHRARYMIVSGRQLKC